jgi:hypothetical protein
LIGAPPLEVGGVITTLAVVELPVGTEPAAAAGAAGRAGTTPIVIVAVPESIAPLGNVVRAVIVNCVGDIATVDEPEIVPVAVSKVRPAGSGP